jgi:hypothetical protein
MQIAPFSNFSGDGGVFGFDPGKRGHGGQERKRRR